MAPTVKRIINDSIIQPKLPANEDPVEYPADYFKNNTNIVLYVSTKVALNDLRAYVYQGIKSGNPSILHINAYLYAALKGVEGTLDRDWVSFGRTIGKREENVKIFDLVKVEELKTALPDGKSDPDRSAEDDKWLPIYILGLYRVGRSKVTDYRKKLLDGLEIQCKVASTRFESLVEDGLDFFDVWENDPNFTKIVAAVDMFFHMFKKHERAPIRYGTIVSRFKDCAALATFGHLSKVSGLSIEELTTWVLNREVADELCQMMYPGQEIDKADSYMPYMIDFGLSQKSPYSSVKNPAFHFWGQLAALLLRSTRAKNARQPDDIEYTSLTCASLLLSFAVGSSADIEQQFYIGEDKYTTEKDDGLRKSDVPPKGRNVVDWLGWYDDNGGKPTPDMLQFARRAVNSLQSLREKTIGKYAKAEFDK
nr:nucleoprotein [Vesicular stomatitis virus]AAA48464.1 nucleoprotein [Vesicular stomatitis virus]